MYQVYCLSISTNASLLVVPENFGGPLGSVLSSATKQSCDRVRTDLSMNTPAYVLVRGNSSGGGR